MKVQSKIKKNAPRVSRRKEILKIRAEINAKEIKETMSDSVRPHRRQPTTSPLVRLKFLDTDTEHTAATTLRWGLAF